MSSKQFSLFFCSVLAHALLLFSQFAHCDEDERTLLKAMNGYRRSLNLSSLSTNSQAECLARHIAWDFDDQSPFSISASGVAITPGNLTQLPDMPDYLSECGISVNNTRKGVILPVYIPRLEVDLVITNCTRSLMGGYLRKRVYSSIGIAYYEDWAVFILGTSSPAGSFSSSSSESFSAVRSRGVFLLSFVLLWLFRFSP